MIIKNFKVKNLYGRFDFDLNLNEDINIITGRNSSGKTTVLKLMWYLISDNVERALEVDFDEIEIETNLFHIKVHPSENGKSWLIDVTGGHKALLFLDGSSIFFSTFRRIEGGYSITMPGKPVEGDSLDYSKSFKQAIGIVQGERVYNELDNAFKLLSEHLSKPQHKFITSISTNDINDLLVKNYAESSRKIDALHGELSKFITKRTVPSYQEDGQSDNVLQEIQDKTNEINAKIEHLRQPFTKISSLIQELFVHKGIEINDSLILGDPTKAISSEHLSSGDKQFLSFLCYNAFYKNSIIFIDEPELSLHVDWQRLLFQILKEQGTDNQFIVTTHSPFIYSQYPSKEFLLDQDRGDN